MRSKPSETSPPSANTGTPPPSQRVMVSAAHAAPGLAAETVAADATAANDQRHGWIVRLLDEDGPGILRLLWRILRREQDVMDAFQDCFCKLATLAGARRPRNARAYAYRTASNIAIEIIRGRQRRAAHWDRVVAEHGPSPGPEPVSDDSGKGGERLRLAIAELPAHLRNVIVLRDLSRMPYEEVGRTLGIDPATARVYRRHAVVKLAELIGAEE